MKRFDIPICFFIFKRTDKSVQIIKRIKEVNPKRIYIISDCGRTPEEQVEVLKCRKAVEEAIDWDCKVIKNYAKENSGVFDRIGLGALWVLSKESKAIFLEDDNLPEISFFEYCKFLLEKYKNEDKVLWICGTNYFEKVDFPNNEDYAFTQHLLPCGWATWSNKFTKYYDAYFKNLNRESIREIKKKYKSKKLFKKDLNNWKMELYNKKVDKRFCSWDYQMCFSLRFYDKVGIVPKYNQIKNIGVDTSSIHGGTSFDNVMTQRFCSMGSHKLSFPLKCPKKVYINENFERRMDDYEIPPFKLVDSLKFKISIAIKTALGISYNKSFKDLLKKKR